MAFLGILLLSVVVPFTIFIGRRHVRASRSKLIKDMEEIFKPDEAYGVPLIVPSFEFIKYKYDENRDVIGPLAWFFPVALYVAISFLGFNTAFLDVDKLGLDKVKPLFATLGGTNERVPAFASTMAFAFLGGYLWSIQYLARRVANFDLSPISFLRSTLHILAGSFVAAVAWHTSVAANSGDAFAFSAPIAFFVGMFPALMLDKLAARFSFAQLRRVNADTKALCEEIPLDTVFGIDPYIKFRLAEYEIEDVQNLATTNPIQLFVETPYGLYEAMDWVEQAQLILAIGTRKARLLRDLSIRTIFDLERAVFSPPMRRRLIKILVPDATDDEAKYPNPEYTFEAEYDAIRKSPLTGHDDDLPWFTGGLRRGTSEVVLDVRDVLHAQLALIRNSSHVARLRQIDDVVRARLDLRPGDGKRIRWREPPRPEPQREPKLEPEVAPAK
jgi:hypothetical protein